MRESKLPRLYSRPKGLPPKYGPLPEPWRDSDEKALAKLVLRYGNEGVIKRAAQVQIQKRGRGRPNLGDLPLYEKASDADWIDERIEEFKAEGVPDPVRRARVLYFLYRSEVDGEPPEPNETELATIKKRHLEGRKISRELREAASRKAKIIPR